jgi:hypothetical protein
MNVQKRLDDLHYDLYAVYRLGRASDKPLINGYWSEIDKLEALSRKMKLEAAK